MRFSLLTVLAIALTSTTASAVEPESPFKQQQALDTPPPPAGGSAQLKNVFRLLGEEAEIKTAVATKVAQRQIDAPAVIEVITSQQLQAAGYTSVAEALERIPGLALNSDLVYSNVGVRGTSGGLRSGARHLKVLIDGQPVAFRPDAQNFLGQELIPISVIDRIEVLRGPASALYGLNAFLGVVNIVTKQAAAPADGTHVPGEYAVLGRGYAVNSNWGAGGEALLVDRYGGLAVTLAAHYSYIDRSGLTLPSRGPAVSDYSLTEESRDDISRPASAFASFGYDTGSFGKFTLTANYQQLDNVGEFVDYGALSHGTRINLNNWFVRLRHELELDILRLTTYAAYSGGGPMGNDVIQPVVNGLPLSYRIERDFGYRAIDVGTEASVPLLTQSVVLAGAEFTNDQESIRTNSFVSNTTGVRLDGGSPGTQNFNNIAGYAQALWRELEWLQLAANIRYDHSNQFGSNINYRGGAVIAVGDDLRIKLLSGSSYRGPTPEQLYGTPLAPGDVQGSLSAVNPRQLDPQTALTQEISINHELHADQTTLRSQLNGYYTSIKNRIEFLREAGQLRPTNSATSKTWGGELSLSWIQNQIADVLSLQLSGSVSFADTTIDANANVLTDREIERLTINELYPKWMYKGFATLQAPTLHLRLYGQIIAYGERLQSQINQTYNRPLVGEPAYTLPASYPVDLTLSTMGLSIIEGTVDSAEYETVLSVSVRDVFNSQSPEPGFNGINLPPLGRRYYITLRQQF
ncbi:MAG: TonB-dependent receptor plug domain-containing protein [Myxococcota bacterium]|nr:TonB-dependent receptor [Myxococcota bacterium]